MKRFDNTLTLITGGGSGIGLATAKRIAVEGGRVVLVGRTLETLQNAIEQIPGTGHRAETVDCTDENAVKSLLRDLSQELGRFDAAILSAGKHELRPMAVANNSHFEDQFRGNVIATTTVARQFTRVVKPEGGSLVIVSSAAGIRGGAAAAAYSTAKAGLLGLARVLAVELATKGIRVNTVLPGVVATQMTDRFFANLGSKQIEEIESQHLLGLGKAEDVASAAAFLASEDARWMTGSELTVDGGLTCK
ncbi:SDR family oxidoreductase [Verrucomicrobia bacterium]|nr:SDR family oxidoreductase [Verrucomicrobiota bacterium]